ncbi:DUF4854 domain-containing protein [Paenibacillus sp. ACRSA]|uniref:DUF4854 domain-containing protein n=1 Tax=Paenibacillus sp. ACRSA TaxID=2918211 RepID=UPI001EF5947A|nr:DUF4854 domain-containing protein [Paenibacillus sp. ACRSA]MCG7377378.1 DUF4854 domain-containing protein [Paenibacillus sp. ACRSA]
MRNSLLNASSILILGLALTGCGSSDQGNSTINGTPIASTETTPEIIDNTEITEENYGYITDDLWLNTVDANGVSGKTLVTNEFNNALIYQENNNIRKIRSGLGYYMNINISLTGSTVIYTYKLRDKLSFGQIDAIKTKLEEKIEASADILQSALKPQIAIHMQDPVVSVKFETKDGEVFFSQDSANLQQNVDAKEIQLENNEPEKTDTNSVPSITPNLNVDRVRVVGSFLSQFNQYYAGTGYPKNVSGDEHYYYNYMASITGRGYRELGAEMLSGDEIDMIDKQMSNLQEYLKGSTVYSGYSKAGIQFIAIGEPSGTHSSNYNEAVSRISGVNQEMDFLYDVSQRIKQTSDGRYQKGFGYIFVVDLYAEGLLNPKSEYELEKIQLSIEEKESSLKEYTPITIPKEDIKIQGLFDMKKRSIESGNSIKNKEWKVLAFHTPNIPNKILIDYDGERIELRR